MLYIGMDVHWNTTTICILNQFGKKVKTKRINGGWDRVTRYLAGFSERFVIAFEASCGCGTLYDRLRTLAARVVVAHPGQLRLICDAKRKNDRIDAEKLARLLLADVVPPAYVPGIQTREYRRMIEHRQHVLGQVVRCKNGLRAVLRSLGIRAPRSLWSREGLSWLAEVPLPEGAALQRDMLLEELKVFQGQLERITRKLDKIARNHPGVIVLRTIPGIGPRTAEAVVAYIDDPKRFTKIRSVGAYFGLVPCQDASAGVNRLGHITREGPATVRKLLVEASWQVIRRCPRTRRRWARICQGRADRRKIATVAVARHLACCMLSMLQTGEVWRTAG